MKSAIAAAVLAVCTTAGAVVVTGHGATFAEALEQAKISALQRYSGDMVIYSAKTENDHQTSITHEYSGGVITKYDVLTSEVINGLYHVTIDAKVKDGKNNVVLGKGLSDERWLENFQAAEHNNVAQRKFAKVFTDLPAFAVTYSGTKVVFHNAVVEHRIKYRITWQPKMFSDVQSYADLAGQRVSSPSDVASPYVICFGRKQAVESCYGLASSIPGVDRTYIVRLHASLIQTGEVIKDEQRLDDSTLRIATSRGTVLFDDGVSEGEFIIYTKVGEGPIKVNEITALPWRPSFKP